jgi:hypothetical protein
MIQLDVGLACLLHYFLPVHSVHSHFFFFFFCGGGLSKYFLCFPYWWAKELVLVIFPIFLWNLYCVCNLHYSFHIFLLTSCINLVTVCILLRVKYVFRTWILKTLFFSTWVSIRITDFTSVLGKDQISTSVKFSFKN